jgi:predicted secreted protein
MNLAKKLVSVAAGMALVAGVGLAAAPAQAKVNTKKSATIISFKKDLVAGLSAQGIVISAKAPATWNAKTGQIRFPVTKVTDDAIFHSGSLVFTKGATVIEAANPTIITPTPMPANGFPVTATTALGADTPLLNLKSPKPSSTCKVDKQHKKWIKKTTLRVQAFVHLTSDPNVIGALQGLLSPAFTADMGLGAGRVTIEDDVLSSRKPKC